MDYSECYLLSSQRYHWHRILPPQVLENLWNILRRGKSSCKQWHCQWQCQWQQLKLDLFFIYSKKHEAAKVIRLLWTHINLFRIQLVKNNCYIVGGSKNTFYPLCQDPFNLSVSISNLSVGDQKYQGCVKSYQVHRHTGHTNLLNNRTNTYQSHWDQLFLS